MRKNTFDTIIGPIAFGENGEWTTPRIICIQFQGITGNDLDQFKDWSRQVVVYPAQYKSGKLVYPLAVGGSRADQEKRHHEFRLCRSRRHGAADRAAPDGGGPCVTGWNRSRDKAAPLIEAGMRWAPTRRARSRPTPRSCSPSSPMPRRCARWRSARTASCGPAPRRHLHRHEHDRAGRKPRGRRRVRQGRRRSCSTPRCPAAR